MSCQQKVSRGSWRHRLVLVAATFVVATAAGARVSQAQLLDLDPSALGLEMLSECLAAGDSTPGDCEGAVNDALAEITAGTFVCSISPGASGVGGDSLPEELLSTLREPSMPPESTKVTFVSAEFQDPAPPPPPAPPAPKRKLTPEEIRELVNLRVCMYWREKLKNQPNGGDQDHDGKPDVIDNSSYHGHGIRAPYKIPWGARADGLFNCEFFAMYWREAFMATCTGAGKDGQCWIVFSQGHQTILYQYQGHYFQIEPQGGSSFFIAAPSFDPSRLPGRGDKRKIGNATYFNYQLCTWLDYEDKTK